MTVIGMDMGGTIIKIGVVQNGTLIASDNIDAQSKIGLQPSLPSIENSIHSLIQKTGLFPNVIEGIGIAFPGIVDSVQNKVLSTNKKYHDAEEFDFNGWAVQKFGLPIMMDNDARIALLGEWKFGAGKGKDNIVMITLGTGVGGAAMINGKVLRGKHFQAGCLGGHFIIQLNGHECSCGNMGCVEAEASSWRIAELIKSHPDISHSTLANKKADFESLFQCAVAGDELSVSIRDHCLDVWSAGMINMIHAYDPERVIMSGGVMKSADTILPYIQNKVNKYAWAPWGEVEIISSHIPDASGLMGCYVLFDENKKRNRP